MNPGKPVPGLTRDLRQPHEAPDQVRGGGKVNATLTSARKLLKTNDPKSRPLWTHP